MGMRGVLVTMETLLAEVKLTEVTVIVDGAVRAVVRLITVIASPGEACSIEYRWVHGCERVYGVQWVYERTVEASLAQVHLTLPTMIVRVLRGVYDVTAVTAPLSVCSRID